MATDWPGLRAAAARAAEHAYAPYSGLRVGAAGQTSDGRVVVGCNVENASYGLTLCAECGLVSALHASGGGTLAAVSVVSRADSASSDPATPPSASSDPATPPHLLLPCGRCRQLLMEAGGPGLLVDTEDGPTELARLLPAAFTSADLPGDGATRDQADG